MKTQQHQNRSEDLGAIGIDVSHTLPARTAEMEHREHFRRVTSWLALAGGALSLGALITFGVYHAWASPELQSVIRNHFAAVVGLPCAALAALVIVLVLEGASGPIKFSGLGMTFEGAAAPIVFWVICFTAIALAIKLLY